MGTRRIVRDAVTRGGVLAYLLLLAQCGGRSESSPFQASGVSGASTADGGASFSGGFAGGGGAGAESGGTPGSAGEAAPSGGDSAAGASPEPCPLPVAPVLDVIDRAETVRFTVKGDARIQIAVGDDDYVDVTELSLAPFIGPTRVRARAFGTDCTSSEAFDAIYDVRNACPSAPGSSDSNAVPVTDPRIVGWAQGVERYLIGGGTVPAGYQNPEAALGPANAGKSVVTLGDGGSLTLSFDPPICNGRGYDFAVFENGFNDGFVELAFVEVSSDGETYARFDSAFLGAGPTSAGYVGNPAQICSLAGSFRQLFGTPFDLQALANQTAVRDRQVDLEAVRFVRIVDIVGDGQTFDSFGRSVFDPHPTSGASGFDLDAIAVLNVP